MSHVPNELIELTQRFAANESYYTKSNYNEAQARIEFIDPFFELLGWDMANRAGFAPAHRDVVHEDAVRVGSATKAPDYGFCAGGIRKFFVEAKKPSIALHGNGEAAFQLRRYAWSAKLPLSILTNFRELVVYDCRLQPHQDDAAAVARYLYIPCTAYAEKWDEITALFSKGAVLAGDFDLQAAAIRTKRGTAQVDTAFLAEVEGWRDVLARNIALRNQNLTQRELNFCVQRTIDRIVFLRICEDRGIEPYGNLLQTAKGAGVYGRLLTLFHAADDRYNSGLFAFHRERDRLEEPDLLTPGVEIDDAVLTHLLTHLYYPDSPYEFSILPADILGQVYEQFLGKVIQLTTDHRAKVEYKPEVKKAGGVCYTPSYVVDYMVSRTLGKALVNKTAGPRGSANDLRVLDPACGSGSFLIVAYQYLLEWHRNYYVEDGPPKHRRRLVQGAHGDWELTQGERKRILLNSIYGVDIDPQAVETTKLSLLLKVLEGGTERGVGIQLEFLHERALPDLGNNIKCGNSLVGSDFYDSVQMRLLDDEMKYHVNVFQWDFPCVAPSSGGSSTFDVVLGNPPYVFGEYHDQNVKAYLQSKYPMARAQYDTYSLFLEKSLQLARPKGIVSMIVPDALLARDEVAPVRGMLLENGLSDVYHCGLVFENRGVSAAIVTAERGTQPGTITSHVREGLRAVVEHACSRGRFVTDPSHRLLVHTSDEEAAVLDKLGAGSIRLGELVEVSRGEEIGKDDVYEEGPIPIVVGEDIGPFIVTPPRRYVRRHHKAASLYRAPKIVVMKTGSRPVAALDLLGRVTMQSVYNLHLRDEFGTVPLEAILAVLNGRVARFFVAKTFTSYKLLFPQLNQSTLDQIPFPRDLRGHEQDLRRGVARAEVLQERRRSRFGPAERAMDERELLATMGHIDELLYDLFGLSDEEITVVEAGTR